MEKVEVGIERPFRLIGIRALRVSMWMDSIAEACGV